MTTINKDELWNYTGQKLKAHYQNNEDLSNQIGNLLGYYSERFKGIVKDSELGTLENELYKCIKTQIFNGYFIIQEFLNNDETVFTNEWFTQTENMIAQQIPEFLRTVSGDNREEILLTDTVKNLSSKLLIKYEGVYPILTDLALNASSLGAKRALLDEADKRGVNLSKSQYNGIFGSLDDITYLDPQIYINCLVAYPNTEMWEIIDSSYHDYRYLGELTVFVQEVEEKPIYMCNIYIKEAIPEMQLQYLINAIQIRLTVRCDIDPVSQLNIRVATISNFYNYQQ